MLLAGVLMLIGGCAPSARLWFPYRPVVACDQAQWFDVNHDGKNDFAITFDRGHVDAVEYDDNEDGRPDRVYHLADYRGRRLPHLVLLLDSIPYKILADRYAAGEFRWFDPPVKVIPPFPSLTKICYTQVLHAPPTQGMIDNYFEPRHNKIRHGFFRRWFGYREPWEHYLDYSANFADASEAYLNPRSWYQAELERTRRAFDRSDRPVTICYLASASCMVCRYGKKGAEEVLDGAAQLCLQLLYEHQGAIEITMMADHGHNLMRSKNIDVAGPLEKAGFRVGQHLRHGNDVVLELSGLVTYAGIDTREPAKVADALLKIHGIHLAFYLSGDRVILRDRMGMAEIEARDNQLRYQPITADVLGYRPIIKKMRQRHQIDGDGFACRNAWFNATVNAEYPNAPPRLWRAFHGEAVHMPTLMFTTYDGYCAGLGYLADMVHMESTHGSLNQINSATFVMTMGHRLAGPMRSEDILPAVLPAWPMHLQNWSHGESNPDLLNAIQPSSR